MKILKQRKEDTWNKIRKNEWVLKIAISNLLLQYFWNSDFREEYRLIQRWDFLEPSQSQVKWKFNVWQRPHQLGNVRLKSFRVIWNDRWILMVELKRKYTGNFYNIHPKSTKQLSLKSTELNIDWHWHQGLGVFVRQVLRYLRIFFRLGRSQDAWSPH